MTMNQHGDALVVIEGAGRLIWRRRGSGFALAGIWPAAGDREQIRAYLDAERRLLVVFDGWRQSVSALVEEVNSLPTGVTVLEDSGGVLDLGIPLLDWLPQPLRERGTRFFAQAEAIERHTPLHLLPPFLVEPTTDTMPQVRFVRRTRSSTSHLDAAVASLLDDLVDEGSAAA